MTGGINDVNERRRIISGGNKYLSVSGINGESVSMKLASAGVMKTNGVSA